MKCFATNIMIIALFSISLSFSFSCEKNAEQGDAEETARLESKLLKRNEIKKHRIRDRIEWQST